jgi:nitrite reductase/ring-hydroxylating ferredoxin subunit
VREKQSFFIYRNQCPHLGVPLEWRPDDFIDPDSELLRCATHGALFLPETGECVAGPCRGQFLTPIPFVLDDNQIQISPPSD